MGDKISLQDAEKRNTTTIKRINKERGMVTVQESMGGNHVHLLLSCPPILAPSFQSWRKGTGINIYREGDISVRP